MIQCLFILRSRLQFDPMHYFFSFIVSFHQGSYLTFFCQHKKYQPPSHSFITSPWPDFELQCISSFRRYYSHAFFALFDYSVHVLAFFLCISISYCPYLPNFLFPFKTFIWTSLSPSTDRHFFIIFILYHYEYDLSSTLSLGY